MFLDVAADPGSDVVVLTGAGGAFSSGGDTGWMQESTDQPEIFENTMQEAKRIVFALLDVEKPVIAKANATALGATLPLLCDVIFTSDKAKIDDLHCPSAMWPTIGGGHRVRGRQGETMISSRTTDCKP